MAQHDPRPINRSALGFPKLGSCNDVHSPYSSHHVSENN
jgi:hypothetical protein